MISNAKAPPYLRGLTKRNNSIKAPIQTQLEDKVLRVAISGAAGRIGNALAPMIASGFLFGDNQSVSLRLLEEQDAFQQLEGLKYQLEDSCLPLLHDIVATTNAEEAFDKADFVFELAGRPPIIGESNTKFIEDNIPIMYDHGKALNLVAPPHVRVLVVSNPVNVNALVLAHFASRIDPRQITGLVRNDHNRGLSWIASKADVAVSEIEKFCVWGNRSGTLFADITDTTVADKPIKQVVKNNAKRKFYVRSGAINHVVRRSAYLKQWRPVEGTNGVVKAIFDHIHDWMHGTEERWVSMVVPSFGEYGIEKGLWSAYPVTCSNGNYHIVSDLQFDDFRRDFLEASHNSLKSDSDVFLKLVYPTIGGTIKKLDWGVTWRNPTFKTIEKPKPKPPTEDVEKNKKAAAQKAAEERRAKLLERLRKQQEEESTPTSSVAL